MTTQDEYTVGVDAALDAIEQMSERIDETSPVVALGGFLTTTLQCTFELAPNEQAANELIRTCIQNAKESNNV